MHFHPAVGPEAILREHQKWNNLHAAPLLPESPTANSVRSRRSGVGVETEPGTAASGVLPELNGSQCNDDQKHRSLGSRRLRIGYVSPDFREHVIARFLFPLLSHHDRKCFEIFCYADVAQPDGMTAKIRTHSDQWRQTLGMPDEDLADLIRRDEIDILIDLTMHMAGSRLLMFARKPAPVQVTYLAYCSTTGLAAMDYRLTDPYLDPPGTPLRACYSEKTIYLPSTYWCYEPPPGTPSVALPPAESNEFVTFGCLNNFAKVSSATMTAWAQILLLTPSSRLWVHSGLGSHRERFLQSMSALGVNNARIRFVGFLEMNEYFNAYQQIDIALDPFPYNGGTTTCDALWMGVPVISRRGSTAVSRAGLSILSNLGSPEWVASDESEYVAKAIKMAQGCQSAYRDSI